MADLKQILPPSADRALIYGAKNFTEVKTLLADGSVIEGIPVVVTGVVVEVSGGLTDEELRASPVPVSNGFNIPAYDTEMIEDTVSPEATIISYYKDGELVATKTITDDGTTITISVVLAGV